MSRGKKPVPVRKISPRFAFVLAALFALTLAAYWNSFDVPLVFDDLLTIQRNTSVRFGEFNWNLLTGRSILYLTFTLNHIWSGQEVWSYHLVNFVFHFLNGALVFAVGLFIFRRIGIEEQRTRVYALFAAAFFLVHPVQTESVTYISSRSELLSTLFYLVALLLFVKSPEQRVGFLLSLLVAVPFFFGLGSKETVISLPAAIFLYDFIFLSGGRFRPMLQRWRFYLTFIIGGIGAIYYIGTIVLKGSIGSSVPGHLSTLSYLLTQFRVLGRYIYLTLLPVGLNLDYDFRPSQSLWEPMVILSALLHLAFLLLAWKFRQHRPVFAFSIFWFYLTLAPTSSVVPILDVIFEHRLYLAMIGVAFSFPILLELLYDKARSLFVIPGGVRVYSCIVVALLTVGTVMRNHIWRDEVRLWEDVVSKSPGKDRAYNSLAWAHYKRGEYDQAIKVLEKGRSVLPGSGLDFSETLANLYLKAGRFDDAIEVFKPQPSQFKDKGRIALAYNNLGVAYFYKWNALQARRTQMPAETFLVENEKILAPAADAFAKALEYEPDMPSAVDSLANAASYRGKTAEMEAQAIQQLKEKEDYRPLYVLGKLAFNRNDFAAADQYFERAEKLRSDFKTLYFNHGYALNMLGQRDRAIEKYVHAIRIDPTFTEAHHNVGLIRVARKEYNQAVEHFAEVLRLDPKHISSNLQLARIYASQGNKMLARKHASEVLATSPGHQEAFALLQQLGS